MIKAHFDTREFNKTMKNVLAYSEGFLAGAQKGKTALLNELGMKTVEMVGKYIDLSAKARPDLLHHMYEWYKVGRPGARLFEIEYTVSSVGVTFRSYFLESQSIAKKRNSTEPFVNKSMIMEEGIPVTISPKRSDYLVFEVDGETVFTQNTIIIDNPGGDVSGEYQKVFDQFFSKYFTQAFLRSSGVLDHLGKPLEYKKSLRAGSKRGSAAGIQAGIRWVASTKIEVE